MSSFTAGAREGEEKSHFSSSASSAPFPLITAGTAVCKKEGGRKYASFAMLRPAAMLHASSTYLIVAYACESDETPSGSHHGKSGGGREIYCPLPGRSIAARRFRG